MSTPSDYRVTITPMNDDQLCVDMYYKGVRTTHLIRDSEPLRQLYLELKKQFEPTSNKQGAKKQ